MAIAKNQTNASVVSITTPWQLVFVTALVLSQALWVAVYLWSFTRRGVYTSYGTWMFQASYWVYPLLYVVAGYVFAWRQRIRGLVPRLFWAVFLAAIGTAVYNGSTVLLRWLENHVGRYDPSRSGLWAAFGWEWTGMGTMFVLFCLALVVIARRKRA